MPPRGAELANPKCESAAKLAQRLKVTDTSIRAWANLEGAPTDWDYNSWMAFMKEQGLGRQGNGNKAQLQEEKLQTEIAINKLKIRKEEGRTVEFTEVEQRDIHLGTLMKTMLYQRLGRELGPRGVGKDASQLNLLGEQVADEICEIFQRGVETWKTSLSA